MYHSLGLMTGQACFDAKDDVSPHDSFAEALKWPLEYKEADAILDVTIETHRGIYFPVFVPFILLPSGIAFPNRLCTTVSGTAIKFSEPPNCAPCVVARKALRTWLQPEDPRGDSGEVAVVTSLQPTLKWEPFPGRWEDVTYDLTVWRGKTGWRGVHAESIVYERQGLTQPSHQIEAALEASTHYLWAVRAHFKLNDQIQITAWSYEIAAGAPDGPRYYHFWTPSSLGLKQ